MVATLVRLDAHAPFLKAQHRICRFRAKGFRLEGIPWRKPLERDVTKDDNEDPIYKAEDLRI